MKTEKIKKLLKQIKKLKKLKKSRKTKTTRKSNSKNLMLTAELETLKDKIKNQELQLSQIRNPQPAPVSRVSYDTLGIGQQNALNQSNLENIEKKYIKNFEEQERALKKYYEQKLLIDREQADIKLKSDNVGDFSQKRFTQSKETVINPSIESKYNLLGKPQTPIYSTTDNQGQFPINDFNIYNIEKDVYSDFDDEVNQVNNDIKDDLDRLNAKPNIPEAEDITKKIKKIVLPSKKLRPQKPEETKEEYDKYVKKSIINRENYQQRKKFNKPKVLIKDIPENDLQLKIPGLSIQNIQETIDITNKTREQQKNIMEKEDEIFKLFTL